MIACDNDGANDGFFEFNLTQATSELIAQFPPNNLRVSFFRNASDAVLEDNAIDPATAYVNETAVSQLIWVRVESADNGGCFDIAPVLELTVNPIPEFDLDPTGFVCLNNPPFVASVYNMADSYLYNWFDENGNLISQQPEAEIYAGGVYTVIATTLSGCNSFPAQITVSESEIPTIEEHDISVAEDGDAYSLTVHYEGQNLGIGSYEYALNDVDGPYQDEATFYRVYPGVHTVYVRDKNGCGIAQTEVHVLGFPAFFTPNNDGVNDFWNVRGLDFTVYSQAIIQIFDRYGKHVATVDASQPGWNGMYNDYEALSSDYWFTALLTEVNGTTRQFKGHFSLVRR
jgi:gliding motility-associated-like protein